MFVIGLLGKAGREQKRVLRGDIDRRKMPYGAIGGTTNASTGSDYFLYVKLAIMVLLHNII